MQRSFRIGLFMDFPTFVLLAENVHFQLIDGRFDENVLRQVDKPVGAEVAHADGADLPGREGRFHRAVRTVIVAERLVDQQQVDIIGPEFFEAHVNGRSSTPLPRIGDPDLGGEEDLRPVDAGFGHCGPDTFLCSV